VEEDARRAEGFANDRAGSFVHVRRRALGNSDAADVDVAVVWGRSAGDVEESRRQEDVFRSIRAYRLVDERPEGTAATAAAAYKEGVRLSLKVGAAFGARQPTAAASGDWGRSVSALLGGSASGGGTVAERRAQTEVRVAFEAGMLLGVERGRG